MKFKPGAWIVLILSVGVIGWLSIHALKRTGASRESAKIAQTKISAFHPVHPSPLTQVARANLSANIQPLFAADTGYVQRAAAVQSITTNLTPIDVDALYSFLLTKNSDDENQNGQVLKNDLMDALTLMNPQPPQLADLLAQIYHDRNQNDVVRDYAVQHLATFFERLRAQSEEVRHDRTWELNEANTVLWDALAETDNSISGTAILGLERLARSQKDIDGKQIAEAALKIAQADKTGELSRISAMQVCADMNVSEALPAALDTAQQAGSMPLRISAVAAVGALGGAEQITFLQSLIQGADERLKLPAQHALNQINQRLSVASSGH